MLTPGQFAAFTPTRRKEIRSTYVYIRPNRYGIRSGFYRDVDIAPLLRRHHRSAKAILYIARVVGKTR
jgi:hypothetical protein